MWACLERSPLPAKMFKAFDARRDESCVFDPLPDNHYWRCPISGHPNTTSCVVAVNPRVSWTGTGRAHDSYRRAAAKADAKRYPGRGGQAARQNHHHCDCLLHLLDLLTPHSIAKPVPKRRSLRMLTHRRCVTFCDGAYAPPCGGVGPNQPPPLTGNALWENHRASGNALKCISDESNRRKATTRRRRDHH